MTPDTPAPPVAPKRPEWLIALVIVAAFALVLATGVGIWWWTTQRTIDASGTLTLTTTNLVHQGTACYGSGGFADIAPGAQVVITDGTGATVAVGRLGVGDSTASYNSCVFPVIVDDVPAGSDFYGVALGRRGVVQYSAEQLAAGIRLTLGG